ncbi:hypothetical protein V2J09_011809 [Rumex salicifolius]
MGKRNSQRRNSAMFDSDDADSVSSSSTIRSDLMSVGETEEVEKDSLLDQALDALYEKRGSTREKALEAIIEAFSSNLQYEFLETKFATLLSLCLNSIKRGSAKEISLASRLVGLLALTSGCGNNAREILEEAITPMTQALRSRSEPSKTSSLIECLAVITFIGGNDLDETERSMQIMWEVVNPKLGANVVASKPSPPVISAMVSAWAFLLTTVGRGSFSVKQWQEYIAYLSSLLDKDDRSIRIASGEALAVLFEIGVFDKVSAEVKDSEDNTNKEPGKPRDGHGHLQGLKAKVMNQVKQLAAEAGGKGQLKKDLNSQRNLFRDVLDFVEDGYPPETSTKIGGESLTTSSWSHLIQLNFLKHFLKGGFVKHMQGNEFLHDVFGFSPKKKFNLSEEEVSANKLAEKRLFKSPNSVMNKARTQHLNKQRMLHQDRKTGHFAVANNDD